MSAAFYGYVLLRIRPELFYQQNPLVFLFDFDFFVRLVERPGGLVDYASAFLSPLFVAGWLGALVITALTALISMATRRFITAVTGSGGRVVFLIPAVLVLLVLGQYMHPVGLLAGLALVLTLAAVYVRLAGRRVAVRVAVFVAVSALTYHAAAGLYVIFACLCGLFELSVPRRPWLGAFCLASAVAVPSVMGAWLFDLNAWETYQGLMLPSEPHWLATPSSLPLGTAIRAGLLVFFPAAAVAVLWRLRRGPPAADPPAEAQGKLLAGVARTPERPITPVRLALQAAALVGLAAAADAALFDFPKKCLLQIAVCVDERRWDDVLVHARRLPLSDRRSSDTRVACSVNRALFFRGELLSRMFEYPQAIGTPSLALVYGGATTMATFTPRQCSDVLFDLGRVNESEHMAHEALETFGDRPQLLKRMVYINVLKGEPEAARPFLGFLRRSLLHGRWASRMQARLDADPTLSDVREVASRRELMVVRDSINDVGHLEAMLLGLLERNPRNRMAVQYLLAHYLLTRQLDKLAANLHRLDDLEAFDHRGLPRHCEEAVVLHMATTNTRDLDLGRRRIRPETWRRFGEFVRAKRRFRQDVPAAFAALQPEFGDTYFFCYVFGHNNPAIVPSEPSP